MATFKVPVRVPADAVACRNCTIKMPIPGIVHVSQADPSLCSDCAGEGTVYENIKLNREVTPMPEKNHNTPDGWGPVERKSLVPVGFSQEYAHLLNAIDSTADAEWRRIQAPNDNKRKWLMTKLKQFRPHLDCRGRTIGDKKYVYYRIKPEEQNETD